MPNTKVEPTIPNYPPQGIQAQLDLLYLWNPDAANDLIDQLNKALEEMATTVSSNVFTENLGNDIVRISGTESFGVLAQQATTEHPITLPVTLTDTNFVVQTTATSAGGMCEIVSGFSARTTTGFTIEVRNLATAAEATDVAVCWTVIGQKA